MDMTRRVAVSLVLLLIGQVMGPTLPEGSIGPDASRPTEISEPVVGLESASASQQLMVKWAVSRFASAGLFLAPMVVRFDETRGRCAGHLGLTRDTVDRITVDLCTGGDGRSVVDRLLAVHELAHVWIIDNVDQAARDRFMDLHALSTWWDADQRWGLQGVEWAAETIAWAVADEGMRLIEEVTADPAALHAGYRILTGLPVPEAVLGIGVAERAGALEDRLDVGQRPVPLRVAGRSGWSLDEFTGGWTQLATVPWPLDPWIRPNGGAVATSSLTPTVHFIAVTGPEGKIDSITLVGNTGTQFDTYDLVLAWTTLTHMFWPNQPAGAFDGALGRIDGNIRGIVHVQA